MKARNKAGTLYKINQLKNGNYLVLKLCSSYNGQVRGGMEHKFRVCMTNPRMGHVEFQTMAREGLDYDTALALFNKRITGRAK